MRKFNQKHLPKTRNELDEFVREWGLIPYGMADYKDRHIFVAESDLCLDNPAECPWGYYQTVWFVNRPGSDDKLDLGRWIDFDAMHDSEKEWTPEHKRQMRINTTLDDARKFIDDMIEKGRYDA